MSVCLSACYHCIVNGLLHAMMRKNRDTGAVLALMLLAFTAGCMVRSSHLALYPKRFTAQFDFAVLNS